MGYKYKPALFWLIAIIGSWLCWGISAVLSARKGNHALAFMFNYLGILIPLIVTLTLVYGSGNSALKTDFKDRLFNLRRINFPYLVGTFGFPPLIMLVAIGLSLFFGQSIDQFRLTGSTGQLIPTITLTMIVAPIVEELAWRGYGMDSLRTKFGMLSSSLGFGVLWSLWHAPLVFIKGTYHYQLAHMDTLLYLANFFLCIVFISIFVNWLYYKHNRSILAGILLHAMLNTTAILLAMTQPTKCISSVLYLIVSIFIILFDKQMFAEGPYNFIANRY